ncbi:MAG: Ig-like domain-containing protein [Clostridia bacterium]|nr:Ig-like domain-containing protein [Clostridia bacterium]
MTLKKKLLIALLTTACAATGVVGVAGCKDEPKGDAYVVNAVDQNGNPVEGAVFRVGYYDEKASQNVFVEAKKGVTLTATTDKNGKATFRFTPEEGKTYSAYLAEPTGSNRVYPYSYKATESSAEFDGLSATFEFKYVPSSYQDNLTYALDYKRTFNKDNPEEAIEEGSKTLTISLKKDIHSYFTFLSYKELGEEEQTKGDQGSEQVDYNQKWATKAAAGVYEISYTTTSAVTMYQFNGAYVLADEDGIPLYPTETTESGTTGTITVELTEYGNYARATQYFGLKAEDNCDVTITVKRVGEATEPAPVVTTKVTPPANLTKYANQTGTLTLVPSDGSYEIVKGSDGYYHVNGADGPVLHINLNAPIPRVSELSIIDMGLKYYNPEGYTGANSFSEYEDGILKATYDYSDFIKAYVEKELDAKGTPTGEYVTNLTNDDGVYPVDDALWQYLHLSAGRAIESAAAGENAWLLPCQYYMPEGGMTAPGDGSEANPYIFGEGLSNLNLSGDNNKATFTAAENGVYTFESDGCTLALRASDQTNSFEGEGGLLHVLLKSNEKLHFTVSGSGTATVKVTNVTENQVEAVSGDETDTKGTNESNAIQLSVVGYTVFTVDKNASDGVYVYVQPPIFEGSTMNYEFEIKSSDGQIVYNNTTYGNGQTLSIAYTGEKITLLLTANANGVYAIEWRVVL